MLTLSYENQSQLLKREKEARRSIESERDTLLLENSKGKEEKQRVELECVLLGAGVWSMIRTRRDLHPEFRGQFAANRDARVAKRILSALIQVGMDTRTGEDGFSKPWRTSGRE